MTVVASAPGKIVLAGEYAVLFGAPAVCMAVQRRAIATVSDSSDSDCHLSTPGLAGGNPSAVIDAVCDGARPASIIKLDTLAFTADGKKIGIGSSAAITVALTAALENSAAVFSTALRAHTRLQGGAGSGIDVAAAAHGGLFEYEMSTREVRALLWPNGLEMRVLWTGVPASTEGKLGQLAAQSVRPSRAKLVSAAEQMAAAWRSGDASRILGEYVTYIGVLREFSVDHDLGIFDAGHQELTDAAMRSHLVYKPAGAGGGDIGVLFGRSETDLDTFVEEHANLVFGVLPCGLDPDGVRLESA